MTPAEVAELEEGLSWLLEKANEKDLFECDCEATYEDDTGAWNHQEGTRWTRPCASLMEDHLDILCEKLRNAAPNESYRKGQRDALWCVVQLVRHAMIHRKTLATVAEDIQDLYAASARDTKREGDEGNHATRAKRARAPSDEVNGTRSGAYS